MAATVEFGPRPSRSCSSCARRTRACDCSRGCSAPRSSAWSWSSARRRGRARTARCASASGALPLLRAGGRPAGRPAARTARVCAAPRADAAELSLKRHAAVFVAHAVARTPIPGAAASERCSAGGVVRGLPGSRAPGRAGGRSDFGVAAAVAVHAAFFVDEQRQPRAGTAAAALHDEQVGRP